MGSLPPGASGTETLLIVENEPAISNLLQMALRRNGYTVLAAGSGPEALEIVRQHTGAIHLLVTDVVMPDMEGPELVKHALVLRPEMRTLFMSGYLDGALEDRGVPPANVNFIQKPFSPRDISRKVREILDAAPST